MMIFGLVVAGLVGLFAYAVIGTIVGAVALRHEWCGDKTKEVQQRRSDGGYYWVSVPSTEAFSCSVIVGIVWPLTLLVAGSWYARHPFLAPYRFCRWLGSSIVQDRPIMQQWQNRVKRTMS